MGLASFIESLGSDGEPEGLLIDRTIELAAEGQPELAVAIELCAVPRRFDQEIIGVLRGIDDPDANERLLSELRRYPFVRHREAGGWVFHDAAREHLLRRWKAPERRDQFEGVTARLVDYYLAVHERARRAEGHAARIGRIVDSANRDRYLQLAAVLDRRLLAPLAEAFYQLMLLSVDDAVDFLDGRLSELDDRARYGACRALLVAAEGSLVALDGEEPQPLLRDLMRFWDGLLLLRVDRAAEAEKALVPLLEDAGTPDEIRYRALGELGQARRSLGDFRGAKRVHEQEVALAQSMGLNSGAVSYSYMRLGDSYIITDEPGAAAACFGDALANAEEAQNVQAIVYAFTALAEAHLADARREEALESAMAALDLARTQLSGHQTVHEFIARCLGRYFAAGPPEVVVAVRAEHEALIAGVGDALRGIRGRAQWVSFLHDAGLLELARRQGAKLEPELEQLPPLWRTDLLLKLGDIEVDLGHREKALAHFSSAVVATERRAARLFAAEAVQRRGRFLSRLERWDEALADLEMARERWDALGNDVAAAVAGAEQAPALRARGQDDEADRVLREAGARLSDARAELRLVFLKERALHAAALGSWEDANAAAAELAALAERTSLLQDLAEAHETWSTCASMCSREDDAGRHRADAAVARRRLEERRRWKRSRARTKADKDNSEGLRALLSGEPDAAETAHGYFVSALGHAAEPWYRLNLVYASIATGAWSAAATELDGTLRETPWLRCHVLSRRLGDLLVTHAQGLLADGEAQAAAEAFQDGVDRLTDAVQEPARLQSLIGLGDSLERLGRAEEAARAYAQAEDRGHPGAAVRLGDALAAAGSADAAIDAYRRGLASPDGRDSERAAIALLELAGDGAAQMRAIVVAEVMKRGAGVAFELAERMFADGRFDVAEPLYASAQHELPLGTLRLAQLHRHVGATDKSREEFERALASDDGDVAALAGLQLGELELEAGRPHDAARALRHVLAIDGASTAGPAALRLAELLLSEGQSAEAAAMFQRAVESDDDDARTRALLALGDLRQGAGDSAGAVEIYTQALGSWDPELAATAGARLLVAPGAEQVEADQVISAVLQRGARAGLELGDRLDGLGQPALAENVLVRAADMTDDLYAPDAALRLGDLWVNQDRLDDARAAYRRALDSDDATVVPEAALRLVALGEPAQNTTDVVIGRADYASLRLGHMLRERGQTEQASRAFESVARADGLYAADAAMALGDLEVQAGDVGQAMSAYRQASERGDPWTASLASARLEEIDSGE